MLSIFKTLTLYAGSKLMCKVTHTTHKMTRLYATLTSNAPFVSVFNGCQADGLLALLLLIVAVRLQVAGAQAPLVLLLPHAALLRLPPDGGPQALFFFL